MEKIISVLGIILTTGCASGPQWIEQQSGDVADKELITRAKSVCDYDTKTEEIKDIAKDGLSVARYENSNSLGPKKSDKFFNEAKKLQKQLDLCISNNGINLVRK